MRKLTCFVMLPSNREDADGESVKISVIKDNKYGLAERPSGCEDQILGTIDFDVVYNEIILPAIETVNGKLVGTRVDCLRWQDIPSAGEIIPKLIKSICQAEITITDVTAQNPNVFLELGLRLAVKDSLNILIGDKRVTLPFNIRQLGCISYSLTDLPKAKQAKQEIAKSIESYANQLSIGQGEDSSSFFHRFVEIHTGSLARQERLAVLKTAPHLIAELASLTLKEKLDPVLKHKVLNFFDDVGQALAKDPEGQAKAIEHYKLFSGIQGLSKEKLEGIYLNLWELCHADPNRKEEAQQYLEKLKRLEKANE